MQRADGKPLHRTTIWRRKKNAGKPRANRRGRKRVEIAGGDYLEYAGAIVGLVLRDGFCHAYEIKSYPRASDPRPDGDNRGRFYPAPPHVAEMFSAWKHHPAHLAIAAVRLALIRYGNSRTPNRKPKAGESADPRERAFVKALSEHPPDVRKAAIAEFKKDPGADWIGEFLGLPADVQHASGLRPLALNRAASPQVILGMSKQMVSYFENHRAHKHAKKLVSDLMGDKKPRWMREQGIVRRRDLERVITPAQSKTTRAPRPRSKARGNS